MTDSSPQRNGDGPRLGPARLTTWVVVGGIGIFLLVSGILGIVAKG